MDGPGPGVAGVPAREPTRLPHEFPNRQRDRRRRPARLDGQQHADRGVSDLSGRLPQRATRRDQPYAGWHWGNRGGVTSAAVEKPHRSGWRPLLECEFDLAYTPLMELDYGKGRLLVCTLDLEDHVALDPAARRLAGRIIDYAASRPAVSTATEVRVCRRGRRGGVAGQDRGELSAVGCRWMRPPGCC